MIHETKLDNIDIKFIKMAENCILGCATGREFGQTFEEVRTVPGLSDQSLEVRADNLGMVLVLLAHRITCGDSETMELISDMFHSVAKDGSIEIEQMKPETVF